MLEHPRADPGDEVGPPSAGRRLLEQVQEAVLHADEARGALDDLAEELRRLEALEDPERRLVDRREVEVAGRVVVGSRTRFGGLARYSARSAAATSPSFSRRRPG